MLTGAATPFFLQSRWLSFSFHDLFSLCLCLSCSLFLSLFFSFLSLFLSLFSHFCLSLFLFFFICLSLLGPCCSLLLYYPTFWWFFTSLYYCFMQMNHVYYPLQSTGESVPVTKTPIATDGDDGSCLFNEDQHKGHTLFCGTHVR